MSWMLYFLYYRTNNSNIFTARIHIWTFIRINLIFKFWILAYVTNMTWAWISCKLVVYRTFNQSLKFGTNHRTICCLIPQFAVDVNKVIFLVHIHSILFIWNTTEILLSLRAAFWTKGRKGSAVALQYLSIFYYPAVKDNAQSCFSFCCLLYVNSTRHKYYKIDVTLRNQRILEIPTNISILGRK